MMILAFIGLVALILAEVWAFHIFGKNIIKYTIDESGIRVILFTIIKLVSIRYSDIINIRLIDSYEYDKSYAFSTRLWNRAFTDRWVAITYHWWILTPSIIITPDDPEKFVEEINHHLRGS